MTVVSGIESELRGYGSQAPVVEEGNRCLKDDDNSQEFTQEIIKVPSSDPEEEGLSTRTRSTQETGPIPVGIQKTGLLSQWNRRLRSWIQETFTRRFVLAALAGQFVSICITSTNVETTELINRGWVAPTTQTAFLYFTICLIYTPVTIYKYGFNAWVNMLASDGYKYVLLAILDVEGNFLVIKAYKYTDLLSAELLDAWAVPVCMLVAAILMGTKYHWTQYSGVFVCILGLALLVLSDLQTDKKLIAATLYSSLGDGLMVIGATLYGLSNALQEYLVRQSPLYEVIGQLGFWGTVINGLQAVVLEHHIWKEQNWNGGTIGLLIAYTASMLCLYTVAPILFRMASSPFYNISILTSDFYGLIFGFGIYHYQVYWLYFVAYPLTLIGLVIYFSWKKPGNDAQCTVISRGKQKQIEALNVSEGRSIRVTGTQL